MQSFSANASYQTNRCESVLFTENVIHGDVYCFNLFNSTISNNIIGSGISQAHDLLVRNNVFLNYGPYTGWPDYVQANLIACQNTVFSNNIFMAAGYSVLSSSVTNCSFLNNVYCNTPNYYTNNTEVGNYPAQDPNTIFVNNAGGTTYSLLSDYHLQNPALYIGDDGTQCGLYGGFHPFKDGSVPFHPHWIQATVDQFTNQATGEINVNFKVSSQNQ
jgi:hypothetical protein